MSGRPTEPGDYWMRRPGEGWIVCNVESRWGNDDVLSGMPQYRDWHASLDSDDFAGVEWGPKLYGPDTPLLKVIEELCNELTQAEADNCNAWARVTGLEKTVEAQLKGHGLTLRTIVLALGGEPSEETNLVWVLKRIEELRK